MVFSASKANTDLFRFHQRIFGSRSFEDRFEIRANPSLCKSAQSAAVFKSCFPPCPHCSTIPTKNQDCSRFLGPETCECLGGNEVLPHLSAQAVELHLTVPYHLFWSCIFWIQPDDLAMINYGSLLSGCATSAGYGSSCLEPRTGQKRVVRLGFGCNVTSKDAEY